MRFYGAEYEVDLAAIRQAMVRFDAVGAVALDANQQVPQKDVPQARGITGHAERIGVSHMTLRRLLVDGAPVSLSSLNLILAGFSLPFDQVCRPADRTSVPAA